MIDSIIEMNKQKSEIAAKIADLYLEKFPRKEKYGITLSSSEGDSEATYYFYFQPETIDILKNCSIIADEEGTTLEEILLSEGHKDIVEEILNIYTPFQFDTIDKFDSKFPLKFTNFSFFELDNDGKIRPKQNIGIDLTDEEFKWLLVKLMLNQNMYSTNMLFINKPELAQKINHAIVSNSVDLVCDNTYPFLVEMEELKSIAKSILNPFEDILNLTQSTDNLIRTFADCHKIGIKYGEIHCSTDDFESRFLTLYFENTIACFKLETLPLHNFSDFFPKTKTCYFKVATHNIIEHFNLKGPNDIYKYIVEHFNTPNGFEQLKEIFHNVIIEQNQ